MTKYIMNKQDLIKMENNSSLGFKEFEQLTEFAVDCINMGEYDWAKRAIELVNAEMREIIDIHGMIMVD